MATLKLNRIGLESQAYKGGKTTLCAGCGHNSISERIIDAFYEMGVEPQQVVKLSGIGCSSKSPAYFLGSSHGFNAVHGRMPSVGTGAMLANQQADRHRRQRRRRHRLDRHRPVRAPDAPQPADDLHHRGQRRATGSTKGQFSPTADLGSKLKTGVVNDLPPIDTLRAGHRARRDLRRAVVLRRQEAAAGAAEGGARAPRHRHARRDLAVRDLQRSRRLDQELLRT